MRGIEFGICCRKPLAGIRAIAVAVDHIAAPDGAGADIIREPLALAALPAYGLLLVAVPIWNVASAYCYCLRPQVPDG